MEKSKEVLTTGEVAKLCNVAPRTVSKWFDTGQLRGYRIPGSKDRRIPLTQLVRFMKAHGMPLNGLDSGQTRVLLLDRDEELAQLIQETLGRAGYAVAVASSAFEAGVLAERSHPHVLIVDAAAPELAPKSLIHHIRSDPASSTIKLVATGTGLTEGQGETLRQMGFAAFLKKPFEMAKLVRTIEETVASGA